MKYLWYQNLSLKIGLKYLKSVEGGISFALKRTHNSFRVKTLLNIKVTLPEYNRIATGYLEAGYCQSCHSRKEVILEMCSEACYVNICICEECFNKALICFKEFKEFKEKEGD